MWNTPHSPISEEISTCFWTAVNFFTCYSNFIARWGPSWMQTGTNCAKERPNIYPQVLTENSFKYSAHCQHLVLKINTVAIRLLHLVSIKAGCQVIPSPPFTPVEMRIGGRPSSGIRFIALPTGLPTWVIFPENTEALSVYKKQTTRKDNIKTVIMIKM